MSTTNCLVHSLKIATAAIIAGGITSQVRHNSFLIGAKVSGVFFLSFLGGGLLSCTLLHNIPRKIEKFSTYLPKNREERASYAGITAFVSAWLIPYCFRNALFPSLSAKDLFPITSIATAALCATLHRTRETTK